METHNLEKLTDKIYQEGIERANEEAETILSEARSEADKIIEEANNKASGIIQNARDEAALQRKNVESDLRLKGRQAVSELKKEIKDILTDKILREDVKKNMRDENFLKDLILKVAENWKDHESIQLHLPDHLEEKMSEHFLGELKKQLPSLTIDFKERLKGGFRISRNEDGFELSFTDEDFVEFFRPYLNETTRKLIFQSPA